MNSFENISRILLEEENYWVRQSVKVNLTVAEKKRIGKHSIPRPEIDLIAFDVIANEVIAIEVKSFLDSSGVKFDDVIKKHDIPTGVYKLLTCSNYRNIVFRRLKSDLVKANLINRSTKIRMGFIAGHIHRNETERMSKLFEKKNWFYWGPDQIRERIIKLADKPYEDDAVVMAAKMLKVRQ